jgi:hypothetical protein
MWFASASLPSCISHDIRLDFLPASSWVRVMLVVILYAHRSIAGFTVPGFVLSLSWLNNVTAGHTKKVGTLHVIEVAPKVKTNLQVVTNATILSAYCIGNAAGPLMWKAQYKPR